MKILFATGNPGKLKEVKRRFEREGIEVEQLDAPYPEIQSDSLREVVEHGLKWLGQQHPGKAIMIDDSGLFIDALNGFPGVFSAYALKSMGCAGILKLLDGVENRGAIFQCCAGFVDSGGKIRTASGVVEGEIIYEERGSEGFGYDPIFKPTGHDLTFAEMPLDEKNKISHRGKAFSQLASMIK